MRLVLPAVIAACLLQACATPIASTVPRDLKPEARVRQARCDEIARSFEPSIAVGGNYMVAGFNFSRQNPNGARDQYLVALNSFVLSCRRWAAFEIDEDGFGDAELRFSKVYSAKLDAEEVDAKITAFATTMQSAEDNRRADAEAIQQRVAELKALDRKHESERADDISDIMDRLTKLEILITERLNPPPGPPGEQPAIPEWIVHFRLAGQRPTPTNCGGW
uniref:Uncharacterized protein n=1 Tax=Phenylobacterium glaciei TaxID=2803784 RepID=A0A974P100_9CAUL|nr:hypothetical protein JKL49_18845 [Phenylobacterium glaciei]